MKIIYKFVGNLIRNTLYFIRNTLYNRDFLRATHTRICLWAIIMWYLPYWQPVVTSNQARVWSYYLLHSVMSTYNVETMLGSLCVFNNGNTQIMDWYLTWQKGESPSNEHVYTFWRPVIISNQARECSHYFDSCLHILQRLCWALIMFFIVATHTIN